MFVIRSVSCCLKCAVDLRLKTMVISCQFLVIMAQTGFSRPIWHPFAKKTAGAPPLVTHRDRFVSMCTRALWGPLMAGRLCFCRRNFKDAFPKNRARFYVHSKNRARFSYEKSGEPKISPEKSGETLPGIALCGLVSEKAWGNVLDLIVHITEAKIINLDIIIY